MPAGSNLGFKIVDADLGTCLGNSGCDLAAKRTTFELNENVQLRLVASGGSRLRDSDAQIVVKWTDPDGETVRPPSLCLEPYGTRVAAGGCTWSEHARIIRRWRS